MKITVLGSGTSQGVPIIGCRCETCRSLDTKDKRLRVSVYIETSGPKILIDTSPDFRQQMLVNNITDIDAVLYTHSHVDHIMGLDDIRQINQLHRKVVDLYGNKPTIENIKRAFNYIFDENTYKGGGIPNVNTRIIALEEFDVLGIPVIPIEYYHGPTIVYGYRIGNFAYLTDCSFIPESEFEKLMGLDLLIIDALRYKPHSTHFNFEQATEAAVRINAEQTYFTHITHDILHARDNQLLPTGIS